MIKDGDMEISPYSSHDLGQVGHSYSSETSVFLNIKWGWSRWPRICCGSWNENRSPYTHIMNTWFLVCDTVWKDCGPFERWSLAEARTSLTRGGLWDFIALPCFQITLVASCLTICDFSALCFYASLVSVESPHPETRCQNKLSSINRFDLYVLSQCPP